MRNIDKLHSILEEIKLNEINFLKAAKYIATRVGRAAIDKLKDTPLGQKVIGVKRYLSNVRFFSQNNQKQKSQIMGIISKINQAMKPKEKIAIQSIKWRQNTPDEIQSGGEEGGILTVLFRNAAPEENAKRQALRLASRLTEFVGKESSVMQYKYGRSQPAPPGVRRTFTTRSVEGYTISIGAAY